MSYTRTFFGALAASLLSASVALAQAKTEPITLTLGLYTSTKPSELVEKFRPVTKAIQSRMEADLKRPVTVKVGISAKYGDGIKSLADGKVDFSRLGPASMLEARKLNPGLSLLAVESKGGTTQDFGIIAVKGDSALKGVDELKGKSFAFGDETSTIGRYLSQQYLLTHGIKAADLDKYEYLGRHDAVGAAVGSGRFDAGALKKETFEKLIAGGTSLKELARFPNQSQTWLAREGMDAEVLKSLKAALHGLDDADALKAIDADRLVEGSLADYEQIRQAMEMNDQFFGKQ